jgi:hypothetical protein
MLLKPSERRRESDQILRQVFAARGYYFAHPCFDVGLTLIEKMILTSTINPRSYWTQDLLSLQFWWPKNFPIHSSILNSGRAVAG